MIHVARSRVSLFFTSVFILSFIAACSHKSLKDDIKELQLQQVELANKGTSSTDYQFADAEEVKLIAQGDLISLSYAQDAKVNGRFRVSFNGELRLPYSFKENVVGLNISQLTKLIRSKYSNLYNNSDEIGVALIERKRWVQVTGDISPAGNRLIAVSADITQILAQTEEKSTNGAEERKKLKYLKIKWNNSSRIIDLKKYFNNELPWNERYWHGGEVLSFQSNVSPDDSEFAMVRVMGEVSDPGSFELDVEKDFYSYILKAGGLKASANLEHLYLIRGGQFQRKVYEMSLEELVDLGVPQKNDTIVLFQDRPSTGERKLQMAASIASILSALTIFGMVF